ncbi:MAG: hypothetical protein M0019_01420 [Actinomycetota bacterium]|nr:hypothetical protein [Actinomycetota bacterium]
MLIYKAMTVVFLFVDTVATNVSSKIKEATNSDSGEGVVSAAIAVLIFAFLGVILWVAFKATMGTATTTINAQVAKLGQ